MAITLAFEKRDATTQKPAALRSSGKLPAVFYGRKQESTSISVSRSEFDKVLKKAGANTVVTLKSAVDEVDALIHDVDRHPVTGVTRHVDFYVFEKGQKLKIKIPIEFIGVSPAVKDLGGVLVKVLHTVEVEAAPKDLAQKIAVDISPLVSFTSVILAKEISLPAGVSLVTAPDEVIASVYEPKEEVVEEVSPDISQIEVVKKGKEVKKGEEGTTAETEAATVEKKEKKDEKTEKKSEKK